MLFVVGAVGRLHPFHRPRRPLGRGIALLCF
jgi:hypothetical protein